MKGFPPPARKIFLSTPSARRATQTLGGMESNQTISIHALREEGDRLRSLWSLLLVNFYPRPPRGGRPKLRRRMTVKEIISIHALREEGDDPDGPQSQRQAGISIHALREEGDFAFVVPGIHA